MDPRLREASRYRHSTMEYENLTIVQLRLVKRGPLYSGNVSAWITETLEKRGAIAAANRATVCRFNRAIA